MQTLTLVCSLAAILASGAFAQQQNAGAAINLRSQAIDTVFNSVTDVLGNITLPTISVNVLNGFASVSGIHATHFVPPAKSMIVQEGRFELGLSGGDMVFEGNWEAQVTFIFTFYFGGHFSVAASQITSQISLLGGTGTEPYDPTTTGCQFDLGNFGIGFGGGLTSALLHLFRGPIAGIVQSTVNGLACDSLTTALATGGAVLELNGVNFAADASFLFAPVITADSITTFVSGDINVSPPSAPTSVPAPVLDLSQPFGPRDVYIHTSLFSPGAFFDNGHKANALDLEVTAELAAGISPAFAEVLLFSCDTVCMGTIFPTIAALFPTGQAELRVNTVDPAPSFSFNPASGVNLLALDMVLNFNMTLVAVAADGSKVDAIDLQGSVVPIIVPSVANDRLHLTVVNTNNQFTLRGVQPLIGGPVDEALILRDMQGIVTIGVLTVNNMFVEGVELPSFEGLGLSDIGMQHVAPDTIAIATNFAFQASSPTRMQASSFGEWFAALYQEIVRHFRANLQTPKKQE